MNIGFVCVRFISAALLMCTCATSAGDQQPAWTGQGDYRIVVEVAPVQNLGTAEDEMVARADVDLYSLFPATPDGHRIDLHTVQVIRQDSHAAPFAKHIQQRSPQDRPFRFYDRGLLDEFPTWRRYASLEALGQRPVMQAKERLQFGHRVFNPVAEHVQGTVVWAHTQTGNTASTYGIYFDVIPSTQAVSSPPAGWIGDGSNRIVKDSLAVGPPGNGSASVVDWNADGLPDLLYGVSSGYVVVAENTGSLQNPLFDRRRLILDASGAPIDVGYDACPLSIDWSGDGVRDLLIGAEKGCVLYFANQGTDADPAFEFTGFVEADGTMLLTPNWPIAEQPHGKAGDVFPADYLAIPYVCDWDGDGDSDLLAGGFVTGWVFLFENVGSLDDGTPDLRARGAAYGGRRTTRHRLGSRAGYGGPGP